MWSRLSINTDMVIVSIGFKKSPETGYDREISISFQKIRLTKTRTTTILNRNGRGGATGAAAGIASTSSGSSGAGYAGNGSSQSNGSNQKGSILYGATTSLGLL